jgi:TRAP-type transport system periplasmic protein
MAGLVPAIHVFLQLRRSKTWMPATSAGMTVRKVFVMSPTTLRLGGYQTEASVHTRALRVLVAELTRRLGEKIAIDLVPNVAEHGRKAADVVTMAAGDELDICYIQSSYIDAAGAPSLRVLDLPFIFTDRARIYPMLDGAFGAHLSEEVAAGTPFRVLAYWDNGFRHLSNRLHAIRSPKDCEGLKIRTTASPLHQEIFSAFGFAPRSIDPADLAQAVASHKVDAQENPLTNLVQFGLYTTHKHVSMTSHFFGCAPLLINRARYGALSADARRALHEAVGVATKAQREFAIAEDARCLEILKPAGVTITPAEAIDLAAFKAAAAPIVARETATVSKEVRAMLS